MIGQSAARRESDASSPVEARRERTDTDRANGCKGCDPAFRVTEEAIRRVLEAPMFRSPEHCVGHSEYEWRLAQCSGCDKLTDGHTCLVCGCYVRVAAKLKAKRCPLPGENRWETGRSQ